MKFKVTRTTVKTTVETPQGIWDFLKESPCSTVTARLPYLGEVQFKWRDTEDYIGCHPSELFHKENPSSGPVHLTGGLVVVSGPLGRVLWFPATSSEELERLLKGAQKAAKQAAGD